MDERSILLVDSSALSYEDAAFIGTLFTSTYFAAARRRPPLRCARHRLILDEAESLITVAVARMLDQTAKYGLTVAAAVQRLGQLRDRGDFIADALFANAPVKVTFGMPEPESAEYVAQMFFTGFLELEQWKENTKRPVVVGQEKTTVRNSSRAEHEAEHDTYTRGRSSSHGESHGTITGASTAHGVSEASGDNAGMVMTPPASAFGPGAMMPAGTPLSQSAGQNNQRGTSDISSTTTADSHATFDMEFRERVVGSREVARNLRVRGPQ